MCLSLLLRCVRSLRKWRQKPKYVRVAGNAFNNSTYNSSLSWQEMHGREVKTLMSQVNVSRRVSRMSSGKSSLGASLGKKVSLPADPAYYRTLMERHVGFESGDRSVKEYQDVGGVLILSLPLRPPETEEEIKAMARRHSL